MHVPSSGRGPSSHVHGLALRGAHCGWHWQWYGPRRHRYLHAGEPEEVDENALFGQRRLALHLPQHRRDATDARHDHSILAVEQDLVRGIERRLDGLGDAVVRRVARVDSGECVLHEAGVLDAEERVYASGVDAIGMKTSRDGDGGRGGHRGGTLGWCRTW